MKLSKKAAQQVWREEFGDKKLVKDFSGQYMYFDAYGDRNYSRNIKGRKTQCGWNIDHVLAKSKGGQTVKNNLECTNIKTNQVKADNNTFWVNGVKYQVKKKDGGYKNSRI